MKEFRRIILKHHRFWNCEQADYPLIGKVFQKRWGYKPYPLADGTVATEPVELKPEMIDIKRLIGADRELPDVFFGELINHINPVFAQAWMEAVIGCRIIASPYGCDSRPPEGDWKNRARNFSKDTAMKSPWVKTMDAVLYAAQEYSKGILPVPVRMLHQRGIIDMLAAFMGESALCTSIFEDPEDLDRLGEKFTDLYIELAKRAHSIIKSWEGGFVSGWNVCAPGPVLDYQVDASSIFSGEQYATNFLKFDKRIISSFEYNVIHLHNIGLNQLNNILTLNGLKAIQINLDREAGAWNPELFLEYCKLIQDNKKGLILVGELSEDELNKFLSKLNPAGLAIYYWNP